MISLPDWAFYPIAVTVAVGMVAGALSLDSTTRRTPEEIRAEGLSYNGDQLAEVVTGNGLTATLVAEGNAPFLKISATRAPLDGIQSAGAFFALSPEELAALQGHHLRVAIEVRQAQDRPADGVRLTFFVPDVGQDSWRRFEIDDDFERLEFDFVPSGCSWGYGYIGIWPDWDEERNTVDVRSIRLTALEPLEC